MHPLILKGHSKPIKSLIFNRENDLLFSASSDRYITLWSSEYGERIGTYLHAAAVYTIDITKDSKYLCSGDSTGSIYFWETSTGELLKKIELEPSYSIRSVNFNRLDSTLLLSYGGRSQQSESGILIYNFDDILKSSCNNKKVITELKPLKKFLSPNKDKITKTLWLNNDKNIISTSETGLIYNYDYENGNILNQKKIHDSMIMDLDKSRKEEILLTASKDGTSKVLSCDNFEEIEVLIPENPTRNINACRFSPLISEEDENKIKFHAFIAGGQESREVTTTHAKKGGFELLIFNIMFGKEIGAIQGHFGPVNALAVSSDGELLASGAEESSIRVHRINNEEYNSLEVK